jgi:prepilin-type N-terminal cleavage/methylation domain-containing protein
MTVAGKARSIRLQEGFTLLEIIVAVTLVAMIAAAIWGVFSISIRSWSRGTEFIDANQRHRSILNIVRKQLASAYGQIRPIGQQTMGMGIGTTNMLFSGTESSLLFVSLNSLQFQDSPGLTLVSYELDQDANGNYSLVEREARYLGGIPEEGVSGYGSKATPIFENLSGCLFEYYDPGDVNNPSQWVQEWDGQKLLKLPLAVSLTMKSRDAKGNSFNRHMIVPIKAEASNMQPGFVNPFGGR